MVITCFRNLRERTVHMPEEDGTTHMPEEDGTATPVMGALVIPLMISALTYNLCPVYLATHGELIY